MIERKVEQYLVDQCKQRGWLALKFVSPGTRAVPDRVILLPGGHTEWVELKRPGGKPRADQLAMHARFSHYGHNVYVLDTKDKVDTFITMLETGLKDYRVLYQAGESW